jgi:hypothetical protein
MRVSSPVLTLQPVPAGLVHDLEVPPAEGMLTTVRRALDEARLTPGRTSIFSTVVVK